MINVTASTARPDARLTRTCPPAGLGPSIRCMRSPSPGARAMAPAVITAIAAACPSQPSSAHDQHREMPSRPTRP
jgi:hypothetical protein